MIKVTERLKLSNPNLSTLISQLSTFISHRFSSVVLSFSPKKSGNLINFAVMKKLSKDNIIERLKRWWRGYMTFVERGERSTPVTGSEVECLNCGYTFRGNYCPRCGQSKKVDANEVKVMKTFKEAYPQLASDYFRTIFHIVFRPGYMIRDYIRGKRVAYRSPINTLVISLSIVAIFTSLSFMYHQKTSTAPLTEDTVREAISSNQDIKLGTAFPLLLKSCYNKIVNKSGEHIEDQKFEQQTWWKIMKKMVGSDSLLALLVSLPIMSWSSYQVMRRRKLDGQRLSKMEHYIIFAYLDSMLCLINEPMTVMLFYLTWTYRGLYNVSWKRSLCYAVATSAIGLSLLLAFMIAVFTILLFTMIIMALI